MWRTPRNLLIVIIVAFILGLIWYYAYPLKIRDVMRHTKQIEKTDFLIASYGTFNHYSIQFDEKTNSSELIDILDAESYSREIKSYKGSSDRVIMMIIFYRDMDSTVTNYSFDITESGIIICNNKQYQMNGDTEEIFNNLYEWIKNKGIYITS